MSTESGWSNQKKLGPNQHKTIQSVGSDRYGIATAQMYLYDLTPVAIALTAIAVSDDNKQIYLEIPSHGAAAGDIVRMVTSTALKAWEYEVAEIIDANTVAVWRTSANEPSVGDEVKLCRYITAKSDEEGALTTTSGPMQFLKDGVVTTVATDSVTPSNTTPMPVEIFGAGTTINLTAGDINVQLDHAGATFDSTRIGDGTTLLAIEAVTGKAMVKDAEAIAELQQIEADVEAMSAKLPAALGPQTSAASLSVSLSSDHAALPLSTGASTAANQTTQITELTAIKNAVQLIDNAIGADGTPKPAGAVVIAGVDSAGDTQELRTNTTGELLVSFGAAGFSTETTLSQLNAKHNTDYGSSTGAIRTAAQVGNATGAADFGNGAAGAQTLRVSANLKRAGNELAYGAGVTDANTLRVTLPTDQASIPVSGPLTDTQLRATAIPVSATALPLPAGAATLAKQDEMITAVGDASNKTLVPFAHDEIVTTYVGTTTDIDTVTYKNGGTIVATLTMTYDASNRLISVVRS